jgi:hypothetical protein
MSSTGFVRPGSVSLSRSYSRRAARSSTFVSSTIRQPSLLDAVSECFEHLCAVPASLAVGVDTRPPQFGCFPVDLLKSTHCDYLAIDEADQKRSVVVPVANFPQVVLSRRVLDEFDGRGP